MVEGSDEPAFPVVFFDGEKEMNIGSVKINPGLQYKPFQLMLSQKIGISPNQISIYIVDTRKVPELPFTEYRRRIPITGKVNFGLICRQKDCRFLVVLKRSRKSRNRRERMTNGVELSDFILDRIEFSAPPPPPKSLILLKRNQPSPFYDQIPQSDFNYQLQKFRFQKENYQLASGEGEVKPQNFGSGHGMYLNTIPIPNPNRNLDMDPFPEIDDYTKNDEEKLFCENCVSAGKTPSFHPCVRDAVVSYFSTRLGPINRPIKHHHL